MISRVRIGTSSLLDGGLEVPSSPSSTPPTWSVTLTDVLPSVMRYGTTGSGILRLPVPWEDLDGLNYMSVEYDSGQTVYAWVTAARPLSLTAGSEVTEVSFKVDAWRTWWTSVTVRKAHVTRGPEADFSGAYPRQSFPVNFWEETVSIPLWTRSKPYYLIICAVQNNVPMQYYVPFTETGTMDVLLDAGMKVFDLWTVLKEIQDGLQLQSSEIMYCAWTDFPIVEWTEYPTGWLPSIPPRPDFQTRKVTISSGDTLCHYGMNPEHREVATSIGASPYYKTEHRLLGYADELIDVMPWRAVGSLTSTLVVEFTSAYIRVILSRGVIEWQVACQTMPLGKNAYSDYVYSGLRDYEIRQKDADRHMNLMRGIVGSVTGGMQTGAYGMIGAGTEAAGATTAAGAARAAASAGAVPAMAALSAGGGLISAASDYLIAGAYNGQSQRIKDCYMSQIGGIAAVGQGAYNLFHRSPLRFSTFFPDSVAKTAWERSVGRYGVSLDRVVTPGASGDPSIGTGPWRMDDMELSSSDVPPWAVEEIRAKLSRGVLIV